MTSLKDRLAQATSKLFGSAVRETVVPFELICDCGHRVAGIRQTTEQIVTCSACRSHLYVLPKDVYPVVQRRQPESKEAKAPPKKTTEAKPLQTVADPETPATQDAPEETQISSPGESRRRKQGRHDDRRAEPQEASSQLADVDSVVAIRKTSFAERLRRFFAPTRLLAMGLIALLLGTGWWMVQRQRLEQARRTWRLEMDLVAPAIKEKDIARLQSALQNAVAAARVLNRNDAESADAESLLAQTQAVQSLAAVDMFSTLLSAVNENGTIDKAKASDAAASLSGQRFVFDSSLKPLQTSASDAAIGPSTPTLELDCPLNVSGYSIQIAIASQLLNDLTSTSAKSPVLFVANVDSVRPPKEKGGAWYIDLDPDSCILITSPLHAELSGYDVEATDGLEHRLIHQREFIRKHREVIDPALVDDQRTSAGTKNGGHAP